MNTDMNGKQSPLFTVEFILLAFRIFTYLLCVICVLILFCSIIKDIDCIYNFKDIKDCEIIFMNFEKFFGISTLATMISLVSLNNFVVSFIYDKRADFKYGLHVDFYLKRIFGCKRIVLCFRILSLVCIILNIIFYIKEFRNCFFAIFLLCIYFGVTTMLSWSILTSDLFLDEVLLHELETSIFYCKIYLSEMEFDFLIQENHQKYVSKVLYVALNIIHLKDVENMTHIFDIFINMIERYNFKQENKLMDEFIIFYQIFDGTLHLCNTSNQILNQANCKDFEINLNVTYEKILNYANNDYVSNPYKSYWHKIIFAGFITGILYSKNKFAINIIKDHNIRSNNNYLLNILMMLYMESTLENNKNSRKYLKDFFSDDKYNYTMIKQYLTGNEYFFSQIIGYWSILKICHIQQYNEIIHCILRDLCNRNERDFIPYTKIIHVILRREA